MADLFASGLVADLVLLCLLAEVIGLAAWRRWKRTGPTMADILALALPGAFLALALRGALTGAAWQWIALALSAAFLAHLADLSRRWPR